MLYEFHLGKSHIDRYTYGIWYKVNLIIYIKYMGAMGSIDPILAPGKDIL